MRVSVLIKAYNHEPFIARAIESVLAQETDVAYEIVVGEDCSTDRTRDVLRDIRDRHPERIRVLLRERNLGNIRNFTDTLSACTGEYVALLDGDDYWTSPHKLQRQVAFLDAHPAFSSCACNAAVVDASGETVIGTYCPDERSQAIPLRRMLISDPVPTSTVMFRRRLIGEFPAWYSTIMMGDWPLLVLLLQHGDMVRGADRGCAPRACRRAVVRRRAGAPPPGAHRDLRAPQRGARLRARRPGPRAHRRNTWRSPSRRKQAGDWRRADKYVRRACASVVGTGACCCGAPFSSCSPAC